MNAAPVNQSFSGVSLGTGGRGEGRGKGGRAYLLEVVNHEEDVGVAHLGLLPFTVHGVFAGRGEHLLSRPEGEEPPLYLLDSGSIGEVPT